MFQKAAVERMHRNAGMVCVVMTSESGPRIKVYLPQKPATVTDAFNMLSPRQKRIVSSFVKVNGGLKL